MMNRITNLEITPAQLALDPCNASVVITDVNTGDVLAMVWLYFYPAVGWCMIVIALLIAVVRVLTGVHHIRDVAAGLALGFACGFVGMWLL